MSYWHSEVRNSSCDCNVKCPAVFNDSSFILRSDYYTVNGAGIVPYIITKYRRTKAFQSVVMVG